MKIDKNTYVQSNTDIHTDTQKHTHSENHPFTFRDTHGCPELKNKYSLICDYSHSEGEMRSAEPNTGIKQFRKFIKTISYTYYQNK